MTHAPCAQHGFLRDVLRIGSGRRPAGRLAVAEAADGEPVPVAAMLVGVTLLEPETIFSAQPVVVVMGSAKSTKRAAELAHDD
jgi:hypothetical protein